MTVKKISKKEEKENPLIVRLVSFGLTPDEAGIYVYLLERGIETGGSKIALGTGLHRQYVYLAIPELIKLGLVEEIPHGKQNKYKARPPREIEKIGRKRAVVAGDLAKDLNAISNVGNEQDFEVIQGKRAIQQYEFEQVRQADDTWEEYIIGGSTEGYSNVMGEHLDDHLAELQRKKLSVKYIGSMDELPLYRDYVGKFDNQEYRFLEKLPKGVTHLVVRKDSVSFYTFLNPPLVYVLKSPIVAENYKQFFMMLWEMAWKAA